MLLPAQLSVESHNEIICCIGIWDLCAFDVDWILCNPLICKVDMYRFRFVEFSLPFLSSLHWKFFVVAETPF
jgi:hypothetical protein